MTVRAAGVEWKHAPLLASLAGLAGFVAITETFIRSGVISRFAVPAPSEVALSFGRLITEERVLLRFLETMGEALAAGVVIAAVGLSVGALLYRVPLLRSAFETWVAALASAPIVLAYPLFLVIFGRNAATIVIMGFLAGLAPMILKTIEGLAGARRVFIEVGKSFRLTPLQLFRKILLPAALPTIFTGLRLGMIFALINIVGVEYLINLGGLGQLLNDLAERFDLPAMYAVICFVVLVSVCFFAVLERTERWLRPAN